ncbi:MAG: hypothetical protein PHV48_01465 [Candidatus Omnitrophica bacterium]|nr:hypothetical protein [Candidatus Omnitrophota bacterium]
MKKKVKYFYRRYKKELFSTAVTIILTIIPLCIPDSNIKISLSLSLMVIFFGLIVTIYFYLKEKDFFYISFNRREDKDDWAGEGNFEYFRSDKSYMITHSYSGFIFQKIFTWTDYRIYFDFQITNKCLGVILRAMNLSNYIMMQINYYGIRPHLRINGGWLIQEAEQEGLVFPQKLLKNTWYRCEILCDKRMICIKIIDKNKFIVDQKWRIPSGAVPFVFSGENAKVTIPFPIDLEYGTVGFRSDGDESALVRDLLVEKV